MRKLRPRGIKELTRVTEIICTRAVMWPQLCSLSTTSASSLCMQPPEFIQRVIWFGSWFPKPDSLWTLSLIPLSAKCHLLATAAAYRQISQIFFSSCQTIPAFHSSRCEKGLFTVVISTRLLLSSGQVPFPSLSQPQNVWSCSKARVSAIPPPKSLPWYPEAETVLFAPQHPPPSEYFHGRPGKFMHTSVSLTSLWIL